MPKPARFASPCPAQRGRNCPDLARPGHDAVGTLRLTSAAGDHAVSAASHYLTASSDLLLALLLLPGQLRAADKTAAKRPATARPGRPRRRCPHQCLTISCAAGIR